MSDRILPRWGERRGTPVQACALTLACRAAQHQCMTLTRDRRTELLAAAPLFAGVEADGLERIAEQSVEVEFPTDRVIVRQGEVGTGFSPPPPRAARVVRDGETLARLGVGDFFGELSVLDGGPRVAQVIASEPTICLGLASWDLEAVIRDEPTVAMAILRTLATRLRELTETTHH
jgi:CRP-like cAMP-binding protein